MDEAERARKKETLRMIVETLPPEARTEFPDWKINGILDAIEIVEKYDPLIQTIRKAPLPGMIFLERGGAKIRSKLNGYAPNITYIDEGLDLTDAKDQEPEQEEQDG